LWKYWLKWNFVLNGPFFSEFIRSFSTSTNYQFNRKIKSLLKRYFFFF
jgi:hypothetical protein